MSTGQTIRAFVMASYKAEGPPSLEEVARELQISKSTVRDRLQTCVENGLMEHQEGRSRGYSLTDAGKRVASAG